LEVFLGAIAVDVGELGVLELPLVLALCAVYLDLVLCPKDFVEGTHPTLDLLHLVLEALKQLH